MHSQQKPVASPETASLDWIFRISLPDRRINDRFPWKSDRKEFIRVPPHARSPGIRQFLWPAHPNNAPTLSSKEMPRANTFANGAKALVSYAQFMVTPHFPMQSKGEVRTGEYGQGGSFRQHTLLPMRYSGIERWLCPPWDA